MPCGHPKEKGGGIRRRSPWILEVLNVHCMNCRAFIALKDFWASGIKVENIAI